jgi:hypothetical protein
MEESYDTQKAIVNLRPGRARNTGGKEARMDALFAYITVAGAEEARRIGKTLFA